MDKQGESLSLTFLGNQAKKSDKMRDKFPKEFHHLEKQNPTALLGSTRFLL